MNIVLDRRAVIEYPTKAANANRGSPTIAWTLLAVVSANVQDELPSRSEAVKQGLKTAANRARIRFRYRTDVDATMRIVVRGPTVRTFQIIGGPSELGRREYTEVMGEEYSS